VKNRNRKSVQTKKLSKRKMRWIERTVNNDRSYKLAVYNRFFIFFISVLLQICVYVFTLFLIDYNAGVYVQFFFGAISLIAVVWLINRTDRPTARLNWIVLILVFPVVGIMMYLSFGDGRPTRKMNAKIQAVKCDKKTLFSTSPRVKTKLQMAGRAAAVGNYLTQTLNFPAFDDGNVTYYANGEELFEEMLAAIKTAKKFILAEYFIVAGGEMWTRLREELLKKAMEGVQIRFIYDDFGSLFHLPPKYDRYLETLHENIKCLSFNKVVPIFAVRLNNRDHRKILVVDGKTAFTGGINLADEYIGKKMRFGHWKDSGLKITGNAVHSFTVMFFEIFNAFHPQKENVEIYLASQDGTQTAAQPPKPQPQPAPPEKPRQTDGIAIPYDDSPLDKTSVGETVYLDMINAAEKYLYIFTPYLILDDFMRAALCSAAARGVDVRIVTPGIPDKKMVFRLTRANYPTLLKAGVKIYEYTPGFLHSKSMLCDGKCGVVGTINLDYRSLYLHFENAVLFTHTEALNALKKDCEETFALSRQRTESDCKRGFFGRLFDSLLRLFETIA